MAISRAVNSALGLHGGYGPAAQQDQEPPETALQVGRGRWHLLPRCRAAPCPCVPRGVVPRSALPCAMPPRPHPWPAPPQEALGWLRRRKLRLNLRPLAEVQTLLWLAGVGLVLYWVALWLATPYEPSSEAGVQQHWQHQHQQRHAHQHGHHQGQQQQQQYRHQAAAHHHEAWREEAAHGGHGGQAEAPGDDYFS